jgi:hypothetical protein
MPPRFGCRLLAASDANGIPNAAAPAMALVVAMN